MKGKRRHGRLSNSQITSIVVLWFFLLYLMLTNADRIDGPVVVSIIMSGALIYIPIRRELKRRKEE